MTRRRFPAQAAPRLLRRLGTSGLGVLVGFIVTGLALAVFGCVTAGAATAGRASAGKSAAEHAGGTSAPAGHGTADRGAVDVIPAQRVSPEQLAQLPVADTFGTVPGARVDLQARSFGNVVRIARPTPAYAEPGGPAVASIPAEQIGMPTWLPVIDDRPGWLQVRLPARPNGATAWVRAQDLQRARTSWSVRVDLSDQELTVRHRGRLVGGWAVGEGTSETPTPAGETFLLASFVDSGQGYSPVIFATGAHSDTLDGYGGGPGTVAVHGWPTADGRTGRVSHGCLRVPAAALDAFRLLPLGTPISLVA